MADPSPPEILVIVPDDSTVGRCSGWIADLPCRVLLDGEPIPSNVGVIKVDPAGSDKGTDCDDSNLGRDFHLPADVSRREFRTVCRLMIEIVRLRRSLQSANLHGENLKKEALTDPLTELPNRRYWQETLQRHLAQVCQNRPLCLAIVDLDHFKQINTNHGHAAGDRVLKQVSASIRCSLREDDFVARLGGDEFGLLFWSSSPQVAAAIINRVREAIGRLVLDEFIKGEAGLSVTASAGYCITNENISPEAIYSAADAAMHDAKRQGRNRTVSCYARQ